MPDVEDVVVEVVVVAVQRHSPAAGCDAGAQEGEAAGDGLGPVPQKSSLPIIGAQLGVDPWVDPDGGPRPPSTALGHAGGVVDGGPELTGVEDPRSGRRARSRHPFGEGTDALLDQGAVGVVEASGVPGDDDHVQEWHCAPRR